MEQQEEKPGLAAIAGRWKGFEEVEEGIGYLETLRSKLSEAVKHVIKTYARLRPSHGNIRLDAVFDETNGRYALMQTGWDRGRRVRGNLIYITIQNGKVVIEYDGTEHGITNDLIREGVDEKDIVLAFLDEPQI